MGDEFGSSLADYEIIEPLGRGATSYVYRVRNRRNNREYALKVVEKEKLRTPTLQKRLQSEIRIQSTLSHPNVVRLFHHFEDDNAHFLVLEFCQGGELFHYIKTEGMLEEKEAKMLCGQLVEGIAYLHSRNIMHRDLKLGNLLLNPDFNLVKIADFGLAKELSNAEEESETVCGTPNYIPPCVLRREIVCRQPHGLSTDLWSLGCIIYACFAGQPPFEKATVPETIARIREGNLRVPEEWSEDAKSLITSLLVWEKRDRLTVQEVIKHPFFASYFAQKEETLRGSQSKSVLNIDTDCSFYEYKESFLSPVNAARINSKTQPASSAAQIRTEEMRTKATPLRRRHASASRHRPVHTESSVTLETGKVTPLDASHLKPIRHEIKTGFVEVTEEGRVIVQAGRRKMEISKDGVQIIYNGAALALGAMKDSEVKLYEYAYNFVKTVKGKTPKVTHHDDGATFMLMWNSPPNFEAIFQDGVRVLYQIGGSEMTVQLGPGREVRVDPYSDSRESRKLQYWVDQTLSGLKTCLRLEKSFES